MKHQDLTALIVFATVMAVLTVAALGLLMRELWRAGARVSAIGLVLALVVLAITEGMGLR